MPLRNTDKSRRPSVPASFNLTPVIDIVFLLIIFFLVVCRFIEAENFPVNVPPACDFARSDPEPRAQVTTLTIMRTAAEETSFAVGSQKVSATNKADIVKGLTKLIDARLNDLPPEHRVVTLRIDKDIQFAQAQYALAAIAESTATDIKLAAFKEARAGSL